jgi:hypothetical protein
MENGTTPCTLYLEGFYPQYLECYFLTGPNFQLDWLSSWLLRANIFNPMRMPHALLYLAWVLTDSEAF